MRPDLKTQAYDLCKKFQEAQTTIEKYSHIRSSQTSMKIAKISINWPIQSFKNHPVSIRKKSDIVAISLGRNNHS